MATQYYIHEAIGRVNITRRKGSQKISMRIKPDGTVSVNHPWYATSKEVLDFIYSHVDWIKAQQQKMADAQKVWACDEIIQTKRHIIEIKKVPRGTLRGVLHNGEVVITIPPAEEIAAEHVQKFITRVVVDICRREARVYLPVRVGELARLHGFSYEKVVVKNLKSKWGSCSFKGTINLNIHLMRLPDHLIDYIILHELAHTREMNHGPRFKLLLDRLTEGRAASLEKEMKKMGASVLNLPA
ncbi:MAG TPA: SprT family zinc-dependent metalloprotease [Prolixibacteraceae bacterium]|nr:SprT family zinc-dependent metalloprotease [Prolixibacteraceae bacterium]